MGLEAVKPLAEAIRHAAEIAMLENFMLVANGDSFERHGNTRPRFEFVVLIGRDRRNMAIKCTMNYRVDQ